MRPTQGRASPVRVNRFGRAFNLADMRKHRRNEFHLDVTCAARATAGHGPGAICLPFALSKLKASAGRARPGCCRIWADVGGFGLEMFRDSVLNDYFEPRMAREIVWGSTTKPRYLVLDAQCRHPHASLSGVSVTKRSDAERFLSGTGFFGWGWRRDPCSGRSGVPDAGALRQTFIPRWIPFRGRCTAGKFSPTAGELVFTTVLADLDALGNPRPLP